LEGVDARIRRRTYTPEEHEAARRVVEQLLRDVASRFPNATVRTDVEEPPGGEGMMELSSSLPGTMRMAALASAHQIDLYLGETIWYEFMTGRRRESEQVLDAVRTRVEAAVAGRFEEKLCERGGKVIASRYVLHRPGRASAWPLRLRPIFLPGRRRTISYKPYG
jgi:hypothetical protein